MTSKKYWSLRSQRKIKIPKIETAFSMLSTSPCTGPIKSTFVFGKFQIKLRLFILIPFSKNRPLICFFVSPKANPPDHNTLFYSTKRHECRNQINYQNQEISGKIRVETRLIASLPETFL